LTFVICNILLTTIIDSTLQMLGYKNEKIAISIIMVFWQNLILKK